MKVRSIITDDGLLLIKVEKDEQSVIADDSKDQIVNAIVEMVEHGSVVRKSLTCQADQK